MIKKERRSNITQVIILITDGKSNHNRVTTKGKADEIKADNITIIAIG